MPAASPSDAHAANVRAVFARVAPYYDAMNDAASLGLHRHWKARAAAAMHLEGAGPRTIIDMACGSGDMARRAAARAHPASRFICADNGPAMLALARQRWQAARLPQKMRFVRADAARVPLPDGQADIYGVAFGLRNFSERQSALAEACRLLRRGGHFLCLEFTPLAQGLRGKAAQVWTHAVVPRLGGLLARDKESYVYLRDSIRAFPKPTQLDGELRRAGFVRVRHRLMMGGLLALHQGWKSVA